MTIDHLHLVAGLIVLAEALNKLERTNPLCPDMTPRERITECLKAIAWSLLAVGAGGAVAAPVLLWFGVQGGDTLMLRLDHPTLAETSVLLGFAVLIVRTRVKEG